MPVLDQERPPRLGLRVDVRFPSEALGELRDALLAEAGPLTTTRVLHQAGFAIGEVLCQRLVERIGGRVHEISESRFWSAVADVLADHGLGDFEQRSVHRAVGLLTSPNPTEAPGETESGPDDGDEAVGPPASEPSCYLTTGILSGLLSSAAGGPIAVLQVACRARGDEEAVFVFGSEPAIQELYGRMVHGVDFESALRTL